MKVRRYTMETNKYKQAGVAILISDKIDFVAQSTTRDKDRHFLMIRGTVHQENKNNYKSICT